MVIPSSPNYPDSFDDNDNLYVVHDALRVRLAEDYNPGDTSVTVDGDLTGFPATGLITFTDQCADIEERAISFFYGSIDLTTNEFEDLEILPNFLDVFKPKRLTNITQNVVADVRNNLKDAIIAIENFIGIKGTIDTVPLGETMEGRINFLRKLALTPRAWFATNKRIGIVPLEVEFTNLSFRIGTACEQEPVVIIWDFGDNTTSTTSLVFASTEAPGFINVTVQDIDGGSITKTYNTPGVFDVKLTVRNEFGEDEVIFPDLINARIEAPGEAIMEFDPNPATQTATPGIPLGGPFTTFPTIRSPTDFPIAIEVPPGENPNTPGVTFAGELLSDGTPIDPITTYTWSLGDDLDHVNDSKTTASYSIGGLFDLKLRVDTEAGAYRITTYEDSIDIIENTNLWLWNFVDDTTVRSFEYGLISETFKTTAVPTLTVIKDDSFLTGKPSEEQQKREFNRNNGFAPRGTSSSAQKGTALLFWASGRSAAEAISAETIEIREFEAFSGTYTTRDSVTRSWNWANFSSTSSAFFTFGTLTDDPLPNTSPTNPVKTTLSLLSFAESSVTFTDDNFKNGAQDLLQNIAVFDSAGDSIFGDFSVYRTAFKDSTGYIIRNDGVGSFLRLRSFYKSEGTVSDPFINIRKLTDMQGPTKVEGQLTDLVSGLFFFNNSGSVSAFNDITSTWSTGGPGLNSISFQALQDTSVDGFSDLSNTLLVTSDSDRRAYLSFDYTTNSFLKFSEIDTTFVSLGSRPAGEQWLMGVF